MLSPRPTSERRAAAARANGAKSRGPVTPQGKAKSAGNSFRHGLRSEVPFADPASEAERVAVLDAFTSDIQPQTPIEQQLVEAVAFHHWLRTCCWKLEKTLMDNEARRLKALDPGQYPSGHDPAPLFAAAFRNLADNSCAFELLNRLESGSDRNFHYAYMCLQELRANPASQIEKPNVDERTPEPDENTAEHFEMEQSAAANAIPDPQKSILNERTQQLIENNPLTLKATP